MNLLILVVSLTALNIIRVHGEPLTYDFAVKKVEDAEKILMTGGTLKLSAEERLANEIILKYKNKEFEKGIKNPESFAPSLHFFKAKELIERSEIFKFIKWLPKGALLHGHSTALVSSQWIIKNITYHKSLMKCVSENGVIVFTFKVYPNDKCKDYVLINEERNNAPDIESYDNELEKAINLYTRYPEMEYQHTNIVWSKFQNMFFTMSDVVKFVPVLKAFYTQILEEAYQDGVMYLEIRTSFGDVYDENGKVYTSQEIVEMLLDINHEFQTKHNDFIGFKIIYAINRKSSSNGLFKKVEDFKKLYAKYPQFIVGFDLVGQEDTGPPLYDFLNIIKSLPEGVKFFFHAGETNWYGKVDLNLIDAIFLNTTRIGHGYSLIKHPVLWNSVKLRNIAIEISPISNQVLHLLNDLRNHPAAFYISENIPIVISNDDPGFWNAKGLSYDFYYAFMSFTPADAGLKVLKQLVLNSINYSMMIPAEKEKAIKIFTKQWSLFVAKIISENRV